MSTENDAIPSALRYPAYDIDATQQVAVPAFMLAENAAKITQEMGSALPPAELASVPMLMPQRDPAAAEDPEAARTVIAEGLRFTGNAQLASACSISGHVIGDLKQAPPHLTAVVITETGHVIGDIVANKISVMGRTEGTLDAAGGSVALHDSASVSGHVRYSRIQVNGADLNATLERVAAAKMPAVTLDPPGNEGRLL